MLCCHMDATESVYSDELLFLLSDAEPSVADSIVGVVDVIATNPMTQRYKIKDLPPPFSEDLLL